MSDHPLPQDQLQPLVMLFSQGQFDQVISQATGLTAQYPQAAQLYNLMGAAHAGMGQTDAALVQYAKSIETNPAYAEAHSNLGATLFALGRYEQAAEALEAALQIAPSHPQATANLGAVLCQQKQFDRAAGMLQRALQLNPNNPDALGNLGVALNALNQPAKAIELFRHAIALRPGNVADHNNLGSALTKTGQPEEALVAFHDALTINANHTDTLNNLGNLLRDLGRTDDALDCFHKALAISPDDPKTHNNLGTTLIVAGDTVQALKAFNAALGQNPDFTEALDNKGLALYHLGHHTEATEAFNAALAIDPDYAPAHSHLGTTLNAAGQRQQAVAQHQIALSLRGDMAETHHALARIKDFTPDDPQIATMQNLLNQPHLKPLDRMHLNYALGKAMDDIGAYDTAFSHFADANAQRKSTLPYDLADDERMFTHLKTSFARVPACPAPILGRPPKPIFIVGMPRSGTSLVEHILASHSQVYGAGELSFLETALRQSGWTGGLPTEGALTKIAQSYRADLVGLGQDAPYITDKLPMNFRWLGFIAHAMPEAQIVHVKRDARATCWSIFTQYFATSGNRYGYDLQDLVGFYRAYVGMMTYWQNQLPGRIIQLDYDALTLDPAKHTRTLLAEIGLPWQDQCLRPHETERRVATVSAHQVRQEIYTGSSDRWRVYEKHLSGPFAPLDGLS